MTHRMIPGFLVAICLCGTAFAEENAYELFQQALVQERGVGDLVKAAELYQQAAKRITASSERGQAAQALLGAARCYEKLGKPESKGLYEEVAQSYADQPLPAAVARDALQRAINKELIAQLTLQLVDLQRQDAGMAARFASEHPEVQHIRRQMAVVDEALKAASRPEKTLVTSNRALITKLTLQLVELRKEDAGLAVRWAPEAGRRKELRREITALEDALRTASTAKK